MTKALFFDIDGTLIDGKHGVREVPEGVLFELRRIQGGGNRLFLCTGRPRPMITPDLETLGFDGYILANGGHVEIDGVSVYEERMGHDAAKAASDLLVDMGVEHIIDTAHHVYIDPSYQRLRDVFLSHDQGNIFTTVFQRDEVFTRAIKVECFPPKEVRCEIRERVEREVGPFVYCDDNGMGMAFEMYSPSLSKSTGIHKALECMGVDMRDSYGFGDGANDISMIRACGLGVAMGNAVPALKAEADIVCGDISERGLELILKELF